VEKKAHVIVVGNEKGGTGKSTVSMHLIVSLLGMGLSVASMDLDARQATLTSYITHRRNKAAPFLPVKVPDHVAIPLTEDARGDEAKFHEAYLRLTSENDVLLIDTPGHDSRLSRLAHSFADLLVTPLNDSFIDLDVLAKVDSDSMKVIRPSHYAEMVWEMKKQRALRGERGGMEWVVLRNRLATLDAKNKQTMERLLGDLSKRIGFRLVGGLGERVIYRELFLEGLTLLDLRQKSAGVDLTMSHVAARQELRALVDALGLAELARRKKAEQQRA
jgi:chromosome partitioning protein